MYIHISRHSNTAHDMCYRVAKLHSMTYMLQIFFNTIANNYRSLLRKMTCKDKESYGSLPPCNSRQVDPPFKNRALHVFRS